MSAPARTAPISAAITTPLSHPVPGTRRQGRPIPMALQRFTTTVSEVPPTTPCRCHWISALPEASRIQVAYTWSESYTADDGWFNSEGLTVQDAYHPGASRGYAGTNVPQALAINTIYDIPVGLGRRFSTGNCFGDYILGNWQSTISLPPAAARTRPWSTARTSPISVTPTSTNAQYGR